MATDHNIRQLVINKMTDEQYDQAVKSADELYLTPDSGSGGSSLPDQTGQAGKFLTTDGSTASWDNVPAGTVTSVRVQAGTGLSSSQSTAQTSTLNTTISIASGYKLPTTTEWGNKQDVISDLSTIRDGASAGATAVQPGDLATVATSGSYNDLINKPTIPQGTVTSVRVQATSPVQSSTSTEQTSTLNTTISLADGYGDTKNPYGTKTAKYVLAGPVSGSATAPTFRALVKSDIPLDSETAESGGTITSLVTTGEKYTWNSKQDALSTQTAYTSKGSATKVPQITTNTLGQVTGITEVDITHQSIKSIKSDNTTAQSTSSSEAVAGSGTINLHKIAKTGTFSDLLSKPTSISGYGITDAYTKTEVDGMISSVYKPAGSVAFASLPTLASGVLGNVYNVTDAFTTTTDFVEGSGKSYPAGTNVVVVNTGTTSSPTYKFDVLAGFVDLSGYVPTSRTVNGKALSANISLTASDVGAISSHQSIKTLKTDNTTAQSTSSSEAIAGSGTINLHKVSKTGSYDDLLNKPTIPTVNNSTITIQKNSTTVDSFTTNAASGKTINITVPTTVAELNDAENYVPVDSLAELASVAITGSYNDLTNKPTIPTKVSDLTNDSGYTTNTGTVTSVQVQAGTGLSSSTSTAQSTTLNTTISIASGYKLPTTTEWSNKQDALPSQSGNSGKFLTTNGSALSWASVDALPSQSGNSGKFLTTNGTAASWSESTTWTYDANTKTLEIS